MNQINAMASFVRAVTTSVRFLQWGEPRLTAATYHA